MRKKTNLLPRRYFRIPFERPVDFTILKYKRRYITHLSTKYGPAKGNDLGEDGMSFVSQYSLPEDIVVRVVFELPGLGEQSILAKVIRNRQVDSGYLTAVQFLNLHGARKDKLRNYIADETKKGYQFLQYF
ncbi:PilZ domain-containing protein [Phosphitispora sp. TUW77]|uniref:PilZ domain-containing protein n=1 Tax=Phosphitispora sp. TUW77 TaxID=3152361 RepID=UPI003AB51E75